MKNFFVLGLICLSFLAAPQVKAQKWAHSECHNPNCKGLLTTWIVDLNSPGESMTQTYLMGETVIGVSPGSVKWTLENGLLTLRIDNESADVLLHNKAVCIEVAVEGGYFYHVEMRPQKN